MKTQEEIEQLAKSKFITNKNISLSESNKTMCRRSAFIKGYTQCQEDMKPLLKDLFSLWETLGKCGEISVGVDFTKHYERLKNSLNKQD